MFKPPVDAGLVVAAVIFAAVLVAGCGAESATEPAAVNVQSSVPVRAASVTTASQAEPLRFSGSVRARERASLTFQVGGVMRSRQVELGQQVEAGQVLAELYNPELGPARDAARARLGELQAQAEQARRERQRSEQLFQRGVVSTQELEQQSARVAALDAGVASARAGLAQTEGLSAESQLRAPFTGRIEALLVEPGEFVAAGQPVMRLASNAGLEVEVGVPAHLTGAMLVGQVLPVWSSLSGVQTRGRLIELGQGASQAGVLYPVIVSLESAHFQSGDAVEVGIARELGDALQVPLSSVMRSAEGLAVFRVTREARVERVAVRVTAMQGEQAILGAGVLEAGDRVVYAGLTRLADGDAVELLP